MRLAVLITAVLSVSLGLAAAGCGSDQNSSEGQAPATPYPEYRADLEKFEAELETAQSAIIEGAPTVEGLSKQLESLIERVEAELKRRRQVVPEPCYAAAHEEVIAYGDTSIAALKDALPQLAAASTITAVLPLITALETEIENRHPDAYAYGSQSTLNVLNALTTCSSTPE